MIYYITNRIKVSCTNIKTISYIESNQIINDFFAEISINEPVAFDTETNGLDAYKNEILLVSFGDEDTQFVIDCTNDEGILLTKTILEIHPYWLGHNIKFDHKMCKVNIGIGLYKVFDTMIADQRLYQGLGKSNKNPTGVSYNLVETVRRHLDEVPEYMNKEVRNEFVGQKRDSFEIKLKHVEYSAGDVALLNKIKNNQDIGIKKYDMEFLIYDIEMPLVTILGDCELEGFILNEKKWKQNIEENKIIKFEKECELDKELRKLRDEILPVKKRYLLSGGKYDLPRIREVLIQSNLFGEDTTVSNLNKGNINWGSPQELINIFAKLDIVLPTKLGKYLKPKINDKGKVINKDLEFTTGEDALRQYLIDKPESKVKTLIDLILDFRKATSELTKYGENFLENKNPVSGKFHTLYRQCNAANGRFQSGGGKLQPDKFNSQNIPRDTKFRHCFGVEEGYQVVTCDLSGAELRIMCSHAQDMKLLELSKGDMHSHMAQAGWRSIYESRGQITKSQTYEVSKTVNKHIRQKCKNLTFGTVYGCHAKKAAKTIDVSVDEGQLYINSIKKQIPSTFKYVDKQAKFAIKNGYLILNNRTNSRIWYPWIIHKIRDGHELDFRDKIHVDNSARNVTISGTQADMIKEAIVVIDKKIKEMGLDCYLLMQVHDELVYKFPKDSNYEFFPKLVSDTMSEVANKYLKNVEMGTDYEVLDTWTK